MCERHYRRVLHTGKPHLQPGGWRANVAIQDDGCWQWTGVVTAAGYGSFTLDDATYVAHRLVYTELRGPIPDGLDLDHLCNVKTCVNPDHLEPVTRAENLRRRNAARTRCKRDHDLTVPGALIPGTYQCHECRLLTYRRVREKKRAHLAPVP
jgi:HNH endonuclease